MYNSLKKWASVPFVIKPCVDINQYAEKIFGAEHDALCYPVPKVETLINREGREVISSITLYVDVRYSITDADNIIYSGIEYDIKKLGEFFNGPVRDIWVVYI